MVLVISPLLPTSKLGLVIVIIPVYLIGEKKLNLNNEPLRGGGQFPLRKKNLFTRKYFNNHPLHLNFYL